MRNSIYNVYNVMILLSKVLHDDTVAEIYYIIRLGLHDANLKFYWTGTIYNDTSCSSDEMILFN